VFGNLVAEEVYDQTEERRAEGGWLHRRTRADIVFVALKGAFPSGSFRDVFEVDGHKVRDRQARIEKLFVQQGASALDQALAIRTESARYNIGLGRTVNEPTLPLMFLHPANQQRFRFRARGHKKVSGIEGLEVSFEEVARPTMVRDRGGEDMPARGRFWIDTDRGTALRSETVLDLRYEAASVMDRTMLENNPRGWIAVEYHPEPGLSIWVPFEMMEGYPGTQGRARYSGYRRFSVDTMEIIRVPN
jgi:hypothetical protein